MAEKAKFYADIGLETGQDLLVDGNATVTGNLTVNGTSTTVNSTTTSVTDSMIELANSNTSSDTLDIGIYGNYDDGLSDGGASEYTGLFRDASDSTWKLFDGLETEPTTTVNTAGTGYAKAALEVGDLTCTTLTATNSLTGASITYPTSDGTAGQFLQTDGSGTLSFSSTPTFSSATVTGDATFDTDTLVVDSTNNRVGIGTSSPAYQVEIENTGANALLVLDRTDGAACFIEGQATRSAFGSVGATPLALAYNSAAVVEIGANGAISVNPDGDGFTFPTTDGSNGQSLVTDGSGNLSFSTVSVSQTLTVLGRSSNTNISITSGTLVVEGRSGNINVGV
jgi:hypothetical protein